MSFKMWIKSVISITLCLWLWSSNTTNLKMIGKNSYSPADSCRQALLKQTVSLIGGFTVVLSWSTFVAFREVFSDFSFLDVYKTDNTTHTAITITITIRRTTSGTVQRRTVLVLTHLGASPISSTSIASVFRQLQKVQLTDLALKLTSSFVLRHVVAADCANQLCLVITFQTR